MILDNLGSPLNTVSKMPKLSQMPELSGCTPDHFLASSAELASLLAQFANPRAGSHSRQRSHGQSALSIHVQGTSPAGPPQRHPVAQEAATMPGAQEAVWQKFRSTAQRSTETQDSRSRVRERQYCRCGHCKWCLDNARWDRIFNEKFRDPTYYDRLTVRHSSTLAEAR